MSATDKAPVVYVTFAGLPDSIEVDTARAVKATGLPVKYHQCIGDAGRWEFYAKLWREGKTFLSIEGDVVPAPGDLEELLECPEPYCGYAGLCKPFGWNTGLGCAKVSAELIATFPFALEEIGTWHDPQHSQRHWCRVDGYLGIYLGQRGVTMHVHGPVEHRMKGDGPSHNCQDWSTIKPWGDPKPEYLKPRTVSA